MERLEKTDIDSKFRFILLAAERAEQVMRGARPKVDYPSPSVARGAMNEVLDGLVEWDYGPPPTDEEAVGEEAAEVQEADDQEPSE